MLQRTHKTLSLQANPIASRPESPIVHRSASRVEQEMGRRPHLEADRRLARRTHRADLRDSRQAKTAAAALGDLPGPAGAVHIIISGRYSLWDCVPAIIEKAGKIERLHVATLGFSKRNIDAMATRLDVGDVGTLRLLCSHYFANTSAEIYGHAEAELGRRHPRAEFLSLRTHCKLVLAKMKHGRTFTLESSANLRSCKNIEQLSIIGSPALYAFHAAWIDDLFARGAAFVPKG